MKLFALLLFAGSAWAADTPHQPSAADQVQGETIQAVPFVPFEIPFWAQEEGTVQKEGAENRSSCNWNLDSLRSPTFGPSIRR